MEEKKIFSFKGLNGQITVYEDKIVITHKGLMGFLSQGFSGAKTIQIESIKSVQFKKGGMMNGYIQIGLYGDNRSQGVFDATADENSVMFTRAANDEAERLHKLLEDKITEVSKNKQNAGQSAPSAADEIMKYKNLLDQGIISQEEFEQKKKQLLNL